MSIDKILAEFKEVEQLREFAKAQHKTIVDLTKKNGMLDLEIKKLNSKELSIVPPLENKEVIPSIQFAVSDEEIIARSQLKRLNQQSETRELTLEEARKVDIYTKILLEIDKKDKDVSPEFHDVSDEDLIKQLENKNE